MCRAFRASFRVAQLDPLAARDITQIKRFYPAAQPAETARERVWRTVLALARAAFEFAPFYQAWGRPVPDSWIEASAGIMARAKNE
jgi:hypothetical protein